MIVRLEFVKGTSKKFWEVEGNDKTLITRWGRIGTKGQEKKKKLKSSWDVKSQLQVESSKKLKSGYVYAKTADEIEFEKAPAKKSKRNIALEDAILKDPDDPKAWLVYADWLQGEGDPRGELIVIQQSLEEKKNAKLTKRAAAIFEEHGAALLGSLRKYPKTFDHKDDDVFEWKRGFIHSIRVSYNQYSREGAPPVDMPKVLAEILAHPSCALVQEIVLAEYNTSGWDKKRGSSQVYEHLTNAIAKAKPKALRKLVIGDFEFPNDTEISWVCIGSFGKIWKACPRLETLIVQGGKIEPGTIDAPQLRRASFMTGGLPRKAVKEIAAASWPKLEALDIWFGSSSYGAGGKTEDVQAILDAKGLPKLKHLGLVNTELADDLASRLGGSKILKQLESLDLSRGTMTDVGGEAIAATAAKFKHLKELDLATNYLSPAVAKKLAKVAKKVNVGDQRTEEDYGRYVDIGE